MQRYLFLHTLNDFLAALTYDIISKTCSQGSKWIFQGNRFETKDLKSYFERSLTRVTVF